MSMYEEQCDNNDSICPYCGNRFQVECEDYEESKQVEECEECGKKYFLRTVFDVKHESFPDCLLNSELHRYIWIDTKHGGYHLCTVCGRCSSDTGES